MTYICVCVCGGRVWVYLTSNVDCTGMFIVYMNVHLHNICMCLLLYYALIYCSLKVYTV